MSRLINNWNLYLDTWIVYIGSFIISLFLAMVFCKINRKISQRKDVLHYMFLIISYIVIALPVAMTIGIRGESVGFDTDNYYRSYRWMNNSFFITLEQSSNKLEIAFIFIRWLVFRVTHGSDIGAVFPMTLLTVMAVIHSFVLFGKQTNVTLGLFMFYCVFGLNMCDQARQILAVSIFGIATYYLYQQQILKYILLVCLATSFHNTAAIGFILLLYAGLEKRNIKEKAVIFSLALIAFPIIFQLVIIEKYGRYIRAISNLNEIKLGAAWVLDSIPVVLAIWAIKKDNKTLQKLKKFSLTAIPFRLAGYLSYFLMRMYYYPAMLSCIIALNNYNESRQYNKILKYKKILLIIAFGLYFVVNYIVLLQHGIVPYERFDF